MFNKPRRTVHKVFLHHSASDNPKHDDVEWIRKLHMSPDPNDSSKPWSDIGYHFFIKKNGEIQEGRPLERRPAAQKGHNKGTIAICLHGKDKFTDKQRLSLSSLCREINGQYENITFHGHKEVKATLCPAYDYKAWLGLEQSKMKKETKMFNTLQTLREDLSGKKTYLLIASAIITIVGQYLFSVDLGVPALPPAQDLGELIQQAYGFLMAGTFRAALK